MIHYVVRPISDRTAFTGHRRSSPFRAGWASTQQILTRELRALAARDVVLELDVAEGDLRLDGMLRANARPASPAIRLAFESKHGPLVYAIDRFHTWQDNARAIALTLQALRRVDDYEVVKRGEQYAGFKALPSGRAMPASHMTSDAAYAVLAGIHGVPVEHFNTDAESLRSSWRRARYLAHPDRHDGDRATWDRVEEAGKVLGLVS